MTTKKPRLEDIEHRPTNVPPFPVVNPWDYSTAPRKGGYAPVSIANPLPATLHKAVNDPLGATRTPAAVKATAKESVTKAVVTESVTKAVVTENVPKTIAKETPKASVTDSVPDTALTAAKESVPKTNLKETVPTSVTPVVENKSEAKTVPKPAESKRVEMESKGASSIAETTSQPATRRMSTRRVARNSNSSG